MDGSIYKWKDPCVPSITPSLDRQQKKYPQTYNSLSSEYAEICHASATRLNGTYSLQYKPFGSASTKIQRNPLFATITSDDISHFKELLGEKNVIQDKDRLLTANVDWMRKYEGSSQLLLQPRSTDEFHFDQSKIKSEIRLREGRMKPIDILSKNLNGSEDFDIEINEPYMVFKGLTVKEMEELHDDIKMHLDLDRATPTHVEFWEMVGKTDG